MQNIERETGYFNFKAKLGEGILFYIFYKVFQKIINTNNIHPPLSPLFTKTNNESIFLKEKKCF